jgi:hypothetical protein
MELDIFFVREKVINRNLLVSHVPAHSQWAYILTKPLSTSRFLELRDKLRVSDQLSLRGGMLEYIETKAYIVTNNKIV